jgi:hypothetical protein
MKTFAGPIQIMRKLLGRAWVLTLLLLVILASPAAAELPTLSGGDPSQPWQTAPRPGYRPVTGDLRSFRPVEPVPWGAVNQRVAPKSTTGEGEKKK